MAKLSIYHVSLSDEVISLRYLFLPIVEWSIVEANLSNSKRAEYTNNGYPIVEFDDGTRYHYLPITIDGKEYKLLQGERPEINKNE